MIAETTYYMIPPSWCVQVEESWEWEQKQREQVWENAQYLFWPDPPEEEGS